MKFSEMKYERPNLEEVAAKAKEYVKKLEEADSFEKAKEVLVEKENYMKHVMTMHELVTIRHDIDTRDEFYDAESKFWNEALPQLQEYEVAFTAALLKHPFRKELEKEFGNVVFLNGDLSLKSFSPKIIGEMQKENDLMTKYGKLIASAQIEFEGKTYTISQLSPFKNDPDDDRRLAAWKAEGKWYKDHQAELDAIYDELVHLRDTMGKKLGYEGYTELGYYRMSRNCYDKNDVEKFRSAVQKYLVPVAAKVYKRQAERLGKEYPMSYADNQLEFRSGNPKPAGTPDDIVAHAKKFYDELSPETSEFFTTMLDGELMSLLSTEGKSGGGYCTGLYEYGVPFIFANFNGTQHDVEVVTHEAGHAFAAYMNRDRIPMETMWPSMEGCEVHSMSMEFFAEGWADDFFGKDAAKFRYSHLAGALTFIPYGTMVDHFQHIVYEHPEYSPKERHAVWKKLLGIYQPWMRLDGDIPFYSEGEGWQRQMHIYHAPFYYIDYCLAQTVALEFWAMIQEDPKNAWDHYMRYTKLGGSKVFTELLKEAELESPFDENTLRKVAGKAEQFLDSFDLTGME
ncbi:MAG: M3 family oligoendopeptidase [Erysipelotrichales bacterium]|nr:M3 family oligoendopeptidase [Erysipelotrichales bacterium]